MTTQTMTPEQFAADDIRVPRAAVQAVRSGHVALYHDVAGGKWTVHEGEQSYRARWDAMSAEQRMATLRDAVAKLNAPSAFDERLFNELRLNDWRAPACIRLSLPATEKRRRSLSPKVRALVMERDGFRCRRCGAGPQDDRLVVDHVVPVASGGSDEMTNLQTLCWTCNAGKHARQPHPHDRQVAA